MKLLFTILSFISLILSSCDFSNKPASGPEDEIYIVADSVEFEKLKPALEATFQKEILTPQPEKLYQLKRVSVNNLDNFKDRKNIIVAAALNSESNTSKFIKGILDSAAERKVNTENLFTFTKYDLWAKNQIVMFLTAPTIDELESQIVKDADSLLYTFQEISDKRLHQSLYNPQYENVEIEGKLLKNYGWIIYVQSDYSIGLEKPENNFVWLRNSPEQGMEKSIFIHWIDNASPSYLTADSIRSIRNKLSAKYFTSNDSYPLVMEDYCSINEVNFKGRYALLAQGLWKSGKGEEGPFISYTFFDESTKRIYIIDGSVSAPNYYKRNLIQQMDATLQSFMTRDEISVEKIDELLKASEG
jgi:hypothetical protein